MEWLSNVVGAVNGVVWGPPMLVIILGVGLYLSIGLRAMPLVRLGHGFKLLWQGRKAEGDGEITPFQALMTSLSATVGTGNISGVATAVFSGGPGALFWMWCIALVGMATKYAEAVCAVNFREKNAEGRYVGGPMYYIKNGLGSRWVWLGMCFAFFGAIAGFGIGNGTQSNSVATAMKEFGVPAGVTGIILMVLVGIVIIGGVKRIAQVAAKLVPFMAIGYLTAGLFVLGMYAPEIPGAIALVVKHAFTPAAAEGGFLGATVWLAIRFGVARGVFSNEAGLGSAPIAHAAATTNSPVRQGLVAMLGTFIDTIVICTITGLVLICTDAYLSGKNGSALSSFAFETAFYGGSFLVASATALFAFTTLLGWSYYCERCLEYLFGSVAIWPFRVLWVLAIPVGAMLELKFIWLVADTLNAMMALPNLIALLLLSPVVFGLTKAYFKK